MSWLKNVGKIASSVAKSEGKKLAKRGLKAAADRYLSGGCVSGGSMFGSLKNAAISLAKSEGKKLAKRGLKAAANRYLGSGVRKAHLVKGSHAAKCHMAKLRAMRGCA